MKLVEFIDVSKNYKDGSETVHALHKTSFSINSGEFVAIIGPSGSGKSTMLTLMGGLQKPTTGKIFINNKIINDLNSKKMTKLRFNEIGFILQSSNLVPFLKIEQQIKLVNKFIKNKDHERTKILMERLNISHLKHKLPNELSGGERQRAAIFRALYPNPSLILADEPTASLDTEKAMQVATILRDQSKKDNNVVVMVTHDERLLKFCDRVFVINDGILEEK